MGSQEPPAPFVHTLSFPHGSACCTRPASEAQGGLSDAQLVHHDGENHSGPSQTFYALDEWDQGFQDGRLAQAPNQSRTSTDSPMREGWQTLDGFMDDVSLLDGRSSSSI